MPPEQTLINSKWLFFIGIVIGLLLILAASLNDWAGIAYRYHALLTFTGVGLVLGAFGSTATYRFQGFIITGAGAIAIVMSFFFSPPDRVVVGSLKGTSEADGGVVFDPMAQIIGRPSLHSDYMFMFSESEINQEYISLAIAFSSGSTSFPCVPTKEITKSFGKRIEWRVDREAGELIDLQKKPRVIANRNDTSCGLVAALSGKTQISLYFPSLVRYAFAEEIPLQVGEISPLDFRPLTASDIGLRLYWRRSFLSNANPLVISQQIQIIRKLNQDDIQSSLILDGVIGAWNDLFKYKPQIADTIFSNSISSDDILFVGGLMGHPTPEVRTDATEFLANLAMLKPSNASVVADTIFNLTRENVQTNKNPLTVINGLIVLRQIWCTRGIDIAINKIMLDDIEEFRSKSGPKIGSVIDDISAKRCSPKG